MYRRATQVKVAAVCIILAVAPTTALAQQPSTGAPPPAAAPAPEQRAGVTAPGAGSTAEYVLGPEDVVEVEVVGQPDRSRARVYTDGTIQLNLVGKLRAADKTPAELGLEIAAALKAGGFYANPAVNVEVVNYASRYVTVLGAVASPSLVPINRAYRLSEILARVGGVQQTAADFVIVRSENGAEKQFLVADLATGDASKDPFVQPGDKIFAPPAEVFYISGQVNAPGSYPVRSDLTARQAIARGGGVTASGSDKKVTVTRGGKKVKLTGDAKVLPGDVLVVGERLF